MSAPAAQVSFVGAGPGAPDLLTLRAARVLASADIVFTDALVHPDTLAIASRAVIIDVGKREGLPSTRQAFINRSLVEAARRYARVVRLKGGDPAIFGRLDEEVASLHAAGVACEIIPGVTSVSAAAADLGLPLTCRGIARRLVMVTPRVGERETAEDWAEGLKPTDTLGIYMGRRQAGRVQARLLAIGFARTTPVAVVEGASLSDCRRLRGTLAELPELARATGTGPVIMLVGEVLARTAADQATAPVQHADAAPAALAMRGAHPAAW